ncbi:Carbonic anhydrase 4 [Liparis tanakae]|uniref:Carbonic anhydrase 4 n=1 Tax=Liparis tanakae TaxID=230148 RepID=A0A4Z2GL03_9TELE|nr:Carbonic anhydrase 4 [Liparis tanakae]
MEMHIVSKRKDLSLAEALTTPDGLAVLGFLIEAKKADGRGGSENVETHPTSDMEAWNKLTSYLPHIHNTNSEVNVTDGISIDDLLGDVNRAEYFRYNGSLTTPSCNEAVVWTIFKESVKMDQTLMKMFPTHAGHHNVFRPTQSLHQRKVFSTKSASGARRPLVALLLLPACLWAFSHNLHL